MDPKYSSHLVRNTDREIFENPFSEVDSVEGYVGIKSREK